MRSSNATKSEAGPEDLSFGLYFSYFQQPRMQLYSGSTFHLKKKVE